MTPPAATPGASRAPQHPEEWLAQAAVLALHAVARDYDQLNYDLFDNALKRPVLLLGDATQQLGAWRPTPPAITLSRRLLLERPWGIVLEVLKHEMAHQYVWQVLGAKESAHGPVFRSVCAERGIDAMATGELNVESAVDSSLMHKVTRLLALAESGNKHEAEAAMSAAQRLMLKHNLQERDVAEQRRFRYAHLGAPTGKVSEGLRTLAAILNDFFFVQVLWIDVWRVLEGRRGYVLEVCGANENVELAEYVYAYLNNSAERLWREHQRERGITKNRDRRQFIAGVMSGFYKKLGGEREKNQAEGLVWLGDPDLARYFKQRYPHTRSVSYGTSADSNAHAAGRKAGAELVLHKGISSGPSKDRKLLGG